MGFENILKLLDNQEFEEAFEEVSDALKKKSDEPIYWQRTLLFIYDNYERFDVEDWGYLLEDAIEVCVNLRNNNSLSSIFSFIYLYEYKFSIEYIKNKPHKISEFPDEFLQNLLDSALRIDPNNVEALEVRADFFNANSQYELSEIDYSKATKLKKNVDVFLYIEKANNNELASNLDLAIADNKVVIENTDNDAIKSIGYSSLIRIYEQLKEDDRVKKYKKLLEE